MTGWLRDAVGYPEAQDRCERAKYAGSNPTVLAERYSQPATYLAIALRIRLASSLTGNSVFAAAFSASP